MKLLDKLNSHLYAPKLTRLRVVAAIAIAVTVDALQLIQLPVFVEVLDVVAMGMTIWLIGFHLLLLPTFAIEFIPVIDAIPTWTGCVIAVIALRGKAQYRPPENPPPPTSLPPPEPPPKALE
jgi:hypothetical protein